MLSSPQTISDFLREIRKLDPKAKVARDLNGRFYLQSAISICGDGMQSSYSPHTASEAEAVYGAWITLTCPEIVDPGKDHLLVHSVASSGFAGKRVIWDGIDSWHVFQLH